MKSCVKCAVDELVWFAKVHVTPLFTKVCLGGIDSCSYNDWRGVFTSSNMRQLNMEQYDYYVNILVIFSQIETFSLNHCGTEYSYVNIVILKK